MFISNVFVNDVFRTIEPIEHIVWKVISDCLHTNTRTTNNRHGQFKQQVSHASNAKQTNGHTKQRKSVRPGTVCVEMKQKLECMYTNSFGEINQQAEQITRVQLVCVRVRTIVCIFLFFRWNRCGRTLTNCKFNEIQKNNKE